MKFLSSLGLVDSDFWKKNWKYAFFIILVFSAIITPDGTGITMTMLTLPLIGLYSLGAMISKKGRVNKNST
jgi:sec-independent protein translocase protein TatC